MNEDTVLYIITFLLAAGVITLLLIEYVFKKWSCKDGDCEKVLGGEFSTHKECIDKCDPSSDLENLSDSNFSCTLGLGCVPDNNGVYNNLIDCENNCYNNYSYGYSYYGYGYPYSYGYSYPYYGYGRRLRRSHRRRSPGRRSPGRRSPGRRGGGGRSPRRRGGGRSPGRRSPGRMGGGGGGRGGRSGGGGGRR